MRVADVSGTIVARCTPPGKGAVAVIRLSGPDAGAILTRVLGSKGRQAVCNPRRLVHGWLTDQQGGRLDEVLAVFFAGPCSYTGEDLSEIHCHGGEAVVEAVLGELLSAGARPAMKGEFTRRAFESGKMDLTRAEAVLHLIEAGSREQIQGALRALGGTFEKDIRKLTEGLLSSLARVEAVVDFPDEPEVGSLAREDLRPWSKMVSHLSQKVRRMVDPGTEVVVAGRPNVGKSSLVNAMVGKRVSIVTQEPGTTRDAVCTGLLLDGLRVTLVDTAGLDHDPDLATSKADRAAAQVARDMAKRAALVVWVTDSHKKAPPAHKAKDPACLWVVNKSDLLGTDERKQAGRAVERGGGLLVSAIQGDGIDDLSKEISRILKEAYGPADGIPLSSRQENAIERIMEGVARADRSLDQGRPELASVDLRDSLSACGELLGEEVRGEVLERIFEEFCVGK